MALQDFKIPCTGRQRDYYMMMFEQLSMMLVYDPLPEHGVEIASLLYAAMLCGCAGVAEIKGEHRCGLLHWAAPLNDNGTADTCVLTGRTWSVELPSDKVAYFRNNYLQTPEPLAWFANMFSQVDNAQRVLIRNTKYVPVPVASNDTEKREYENVMKAIQAGVDTAVMVRPASSELLRQDTQGENSRVLTISDPAMIDKMHYLSEYHAELKKRFATIHGMCFRSSSKSAQSTVDEIHGMDNFSLILPSARLAELKRFAKKCAELWGWAGEDAAQYGELWQREDESAKLASGQGEPKDGLTDDQSEDKKEAVDDGGSTGQD